MRMQLGGRYPGLVCTAMRTRSPPAARNDDSTTPSGGETLMAFERG